MKTTTFKVGPFLFCCQILLLLLLKLQGEYVRAQARECDDHKFGYKCRFQCRCQQNESCNVINGNCPSGCADGFWGSNCQLSSECFYGRTERYQGSKSITEGHECDYWKDHKKKYWNFPENHCRASDGYPRPWCYANGTWDYCELKNCSCPLGLFGIDCNLECHCKNTTDRCISGFCTSGCSPGWKGRQCNHECNIGTFGSSCHEECHCADNSKCDRADGTCLDGLCAAGYIEDRCQTRCPVGNFGDKCQEVCRCSNPYLCNHTDGRCTDNKCEFGYQGPNCQQRNIIWCAALPLIPAPIVFCTMICIYKYASKRRSYRAATRKLQAMTARMNL